MYYFDQWRIDSYVHLKCNALVDGYAGRRYARMTNASLRRLQVHVDVHRCKWTNQPALHSDANDEICHTTGRKSRCR